MSQNLLTIQPAKQVLAKINAYAQVTLKADATLHELLVQCLVHGEKQRKNPETGEIENQGHGDLTLLEKLIQALPRSINKQEVMFWVRTHTKMSVACDKGFKNFSHKGKGKVTVFDLEQAAAVPFYDMPEIAGNRKEIVITPSKAYGALLGYIEKLEGRVCGDDEKVTFDGTDVERVEIKQTLDTFRAMLKARLPQAKVDA